MRFLLCKISLFIMDTNVPLYKLLNNMNYEELEELAQKN